MAGFCILQLLLLVIHFNHARPAAPPAMRPHLFHSRVISDSKHAYINDFNHIPQFSLKITFFMVLILFASVSRLTGKVRFVPFNTNLSTMRKFSVGKKIESYLFLILLGFLISDTPYDINVAMLFNIPLNLYPIATKILGLCKPLSRACPFITSLYLLATAVCPASHLLCLIIIFITCTYVSRKVPVWVSLLLVLLSNDIEINPGPGLSYHENFFTFMN